MPFCFVKCFHVRNGTHLSHVKLLVHFNIIFTGVHSLFLSTIGYLIRTFWENSGRHACSQFTHGMMFCVLLCSCQGYISSACQGLLDLDWMFPAPYMTFVISIHTEFICDITQIWFWILTVASTIIVAPDINFYVFSSCAFSHTLVRLHMYVSKHPPPII